MIREKYRIKNENDNPPIPCYPVPNVLTLIAYASTMHHHSTRWPFICLPVTTTLYYDSQGQINLQVLDPVRQSTVIEADALNMP